MKLVDIFRTKLIKYPNRLSILTLYFIGNITNKYILNFKGSRDFLMNYMGFSIKNGPFKGMKYISRSNGSALFPKLAGVYESDIQPVIEEILNRKYFNFIDVGCAEGYYAVGIAYRLQFIKSQFRIYAYDIDPEAITNARELASLNRLSSFIEWGEIFRTEDFENFSENTVVICDIEGAEYELLNPEISPKLKLFDILVEVHDAGQKTGKIKNVLEKRFEESHSIEIYHYSPNNKRLFPFIKPEYEKKLLNEGRKYGVEWMWLTRKING